MDTPVSNEIVRHESPALDALAARILFGGGKPNASMYWDEEKQTLYVHFDEDGRKYAWLKYEQKWSPIHNSLH